MLVDYSESEKRDNFSSFAVEKVFKHFFGRYGAQLEKQDTYYRKTVAAKKRLVILLPWLNDRRRYKKIAELYQAGNVTIHDRTYIVYSAT